MWAVVFVIVVVYGFVLLVMETVIGSSTLLDVLYYLSLVKMAVTLIKYCPQVYLNAIRKSTVGWSIVNILLDFSGGILSVAQSVLDAVDAQDWTGITGNPIKTFLGVVSIAFDVVFMLQHYVWYPNRVDEESPAATPVNEEQIEIEQDSSDTSSDTQLIK